MLPDYMTSYNPLKERLTGKNEEADRGKVRIALQKILDGKGGGPEFGAVDGSAEAKALKMLGGNTGRFAGNYVLKNYDKLDPMVRDMVPMYGKDVVETEGALEKQKEMPVLPRVVESARRRQSERRAKAEQPKEKVPFLVAQPSFLGGGVIGLQEGGPVPVDGEGNVPPQAVAGDVVNGAPMGMVDVPNGGGPVDDGVPTELPEGTVVINAAAIRFHGTETIDNLINTAVDELLSEGVQISMQDPNPEDNVPVAISNGEYIIPPEVAEKIGYKKLEDMNERGRAYLQKQEAQEKQKAEAQQQPQQPSQPPPESFMGEPMPPEQEGPPPAPVQSEEQAMAMMGMMGGGRVPLEGGGSLARAKDSFINWFSSTYLGDKMDPAESAVDKMLMVRPVPKEKVTVGDAPSQRKADGGRVPYARGIAAVARPKGLVETLNNFMKQFGNEVEPEATEVRPAQSAQSDPTTFSETKVAQLNEKDRDYSKIFAPDTFADPDSLPPAQTFGPNIQRRAEGGFVGDYNYAQPQQTTIGTPFPNAVDSNPQQSQSFLQPNNTKKNSRVELAEGATLPIPPATLSTRPADNFKFDHWLEDFNSDRNITEEQVDNARERFNRFNVDRIPEDVFSDVDVAVQKAGIVFEGDSGFSKEKIETMVRHTGFVETEYGKTIADTNEPDVKKARSHYQIEPKTAYSLVNPALSGALLGEKFNREFKYLVPEGSNKTAKEYLNDLYEMGKQPDGNTTNQDFLDILQNDKYLGATLAAGRYIQKHQQRNPRATGGFIN